MWRAVGLTLERALEKARKEKTVNQQAPAPARSQRGLKQPQFQYDLVIFDFDGTLVDTAEDIAFYANCVLRAYGFPERSLKEVKSAIGRGVRDLFIRLAPGFKKNERRLKRAIGLFRDVYTARPVLKTAPFPGVRETLSGPLKSLKKAIVTNKPQGITERILEELKLGNYFDRVVGHGEGARKKPDPGSVSKILYAFNIKPNRAIYIGDSQIDYQTAKNAGCDFAWASYGYDRLKAKRVKTCASPKEWSRLIRGPKNGKRA